MKAAFALSLTSIVFFMLSACVSTPTVPPVTHIEVQQAYTLCPRPATLNLADLSENHHIGSKENVATLTADLAELELFLTRQDGALDCYTTQAQKKE